MVSIINKNFNSSPSIQIKNGCLLFRDGGAKPINPTKKSHRVKIIKALKSYNKYKREEKKNNNTDNTTNYYLNKDFRNFFTNKYLNNNFNTPLPIRVGGN